jgi:hypothetical protein
MTTPDAWTPATCPMADPTAVGACRNAGAYCVQCVWPPERTAPTHYLTRGKPLHPLVQARVDARKAAQRAGKRSSAAQRGRRSRRKGARVERDFAKLAGGQRVPLSGALRGALTNDVALPDGLRVEVKARKDGFRQLYAWVLDSEEKPDAVVLKADNKPFLIVQTFEAWQASRQAAPVDLAKLAEARRLLEEVLSE